MDNISSEHPGDIGNLMHSIRSLLHGKLIEVYLKESLAVVSFFHVAT
jgi:hypothetical protein